MVHINDAAIVLGGMIGEIRLDLIHHIRYDTLSMITLHEKNGGDYNNSNYWDKFVLAPKSTDHFLKLL